LVTAADWLLGWLSIAIEVHDIGGRLAEIENLLSCHGFSPVRRCQDAIFQGTSVFNVFATRQTTK
jgi:hypothetical protein